MLTHPLPREIVAGGQGIIVIAPAATGDLVQNLVVRVDRLQRVEPLG